MKKLIISAIVLSLTCPIAAMAKSKFEGFHMGAELGYAEGNDRGKETSHGVFQGYTEETSPNGGFVGLFAGVSKEVKDGIILGIEADYDDYLNAKKHGYQQNDGVDDHDYPYQSSIAYSYSLRARAGISFNQDKSMIYATGGYAAAKLKRSFFDNTHDTSKEFGNIHHGWTAGFGIEHFVSNNISLRSEYRYSDYGKVKIDTSEAFDSDPGEYHEKLRYDDHTLRIGASYHF